MVILQYENLPLVGVRGSNSGSFLVPIFCHFSGHFLLPTIICCSSFMPITPHPASCPHSAPKESLTTMQEQRWSIKLVVLPPVKWCQNIYQKSTSPSTVCTPTFLRTLLWLEIVCSLSRQRRMARESFDAAYASRPRMGLHLAWWFGSPSHKIKCSDSELSLTTLSSTAKLV